MSYTLQQAPANLEADGIRRFTEEQLREIARATMEMEQSTSALSAAVAANTAAIAALSNVQHGRVYLSASQTGIAASTFVVVNFNTAHIDPSGIWDNTNRRFKPTVAGYYRASWSVNLQWTGTGAQALSALYKVGGVYAYGTNLTPSGTFLGSVGSDLVHLNGTTDYVDVRAYMTGTASRDILGGANLTYFAIDLVKAGA